MKNSTLRWLYSVPGGKKWIIVSLMLVQALHGASGVLYALLLRGIVDAAVGGERDVFLKNVLLIVLLVLLQLTLRALIRWLSELGKSGLENTFKQRLLDQLLRKDYSAVSAVHSGEWLNRLTNDTVVVADGYVDVPPGLTGMTVKLLSALIMLVALEHRFAAILLPAGALLIFLSYAIRTVLKRLHKNVQEKDGRLRVFLQERLGAMLVLRAFAAGEQTKEQAAGKMGEHQAARMKKNHMSNAANFGFGAAMNGLYLFGVIWCGLGILRGTVSFGTLTAVTQLISQIQSPFANLSGYLPKAYAMFASAERLMEIESFPDEGGETPLPVKTVLDFYEEHLAALELRNAAFTYYPTVEDLDALSKDDQPVVLDNLSLQIRRGETLAFTGQSGCGKSTVLKLLMCLYRLDAGELLLLDRSGGEQPLSSRWRRLFAYVPQGNQLMSGMIREIVSFADPDAVRDDNRLWSALEIACADFVGDLERGLDTLLGERGTGLSEGQMQRLAIARALFSGSPILLLDEATSALDGETEKRLLENLRRMTDKTVVIVTHRPAALAICDRVLRFSENGVKEDK